MLAPRSAPPTPQQSPVPSALPQPFVSGLPLRSRSRPQTCRCSEMSRSTRSGPSLQAAIQRTRIFGRVLQRTTTLRRRATGCPGTATVPHWHSTPLQSTRRAFLHLPAPTPSPQPAPTSPSRPLAAAAEPGTFKILKILSSGVCLAAASCALASLMSRDCPPLHHQLSARLLLKTAPSTSRVSATSLRSKCWNL